MAWPLQFQLLFNWSNLTIECYFVLSVYPDMAGAQFPEYDGYEFEGPLLGPEYI